MAASKHKTDKKSSRRSKHQFSSLFLHSAFRGGQAEAEQKRICWDRNRCIRNGWREWETQLRPDWRALRYFEGTDGERQGLASSRLPRGGGGGEDSTEHVFETKRKEPSSLSDWRGGSSRRADVAALYWLKSSKHWPLIWLCGGRPDGSKMGKFEVAGSRNDGDYLVRGRARKEELRGPYWARMETQCPLGKNSWVIGPARRSSWAPIIAPKIFQ